MRGTRIRDPGSHLYLNLLHLDIILLSLTLVFNLRKLLLNIGWNLLMVGGLCFHCFQLDYRMWNSTPTSPHVFPMTSSFHWSWSLRQVTFPGMENPINGEIIDEEIFPFLRKRIQHRCREEMNRELMKLNYNANRAFPWWIKSPYGILPPNSKRKT